VKSTSLRDIQRENNHKCKDEAEEQIHNTGYAEIKTEEYESSDDKRCGGLLEDDEECIADSQTGESEQW
jgi:hypothetical protein